MEQLELKSITCLIGVNNSGKTSYLNELYSETNFTYIQPVLETTYQNSLLISLFTNLKSGHLIVLTKWLNILSNVDVDSLELIDSKLFVKTSTNEFLSVSKYGKGFYQVLNILLQVLSSRQSHIILENPETFLHPDIQADLAKMFISLHKEFNYNFIIETHSEYLLRSFMYHAAIKIHQIEDVFQFDSSKVLIYEFCITNIKTLSIDTDGSLSNYVSCNVFDTSDKLAINLFHHKKQD